ncbi:MAG TPA: YadA-like family protein [Caulobacteraceae bacterium]
MYNVVSPSSRARARRLWLSAAVAALLLPLVPRPAAAQSTPTELQLPFTGSAGVATSNNPMLNLSQTWQGADYGYPFTAIKINITDLVSHASRSKILDMQVNGSSVFSVGKNGDLTLSRLGGTSQGGIQVVGAHGEMSLTSQIDPITGKPAEVLRYYWETGPIGSQAGSAAVIRGMGKNRLSIESGAAIVHVAGNSRYEWEGLGSTTINFVGYEAGSSNGRTININNEGQTAERAVPLFVTNVYSGVPSILKLRDGSNPSNIIDRFDFTTGGGLVQTMSAGQSAFKSRGYSLTGSSSAAMFDLAGTWNTSGAPTAFLLDITDTSSAAESLLFNLRINSASVFSVGKSGDVTASSMTLTALQTTDPGIAGQLWNDAGFVRISDGGIAPFSSMMAFQEPIVTEDAGYDWTVAGFVAPQDVDSAQAIAALESSVEETFASMGGVGNATGAQSVAVGTGSTATATQTSAMGNGATASAAQATAIGAGASATAYNSVALGAGSIASQPNTVSLGAPSAERRLTNMADGVEDSDGATYRQVRAAYSGVALSLAMASVSLNLAPGEKGLILGVGTFEDADALAVKYEARGRGNASFGAGFGVSDGHFGGSAGVGFKW